MRTLFQCLLLPLLLLLPACQPDEERLAEHMTRGEEYFENEGYEEAIIEYKNVLQIDPNHAAAHHGLALAFLRAGKNRDAFWELRETVRLDSENFEAKLQLGQILIYAGEFEESLMHADEAIVADSESQEAFIVRAQALDGLKRTDDAVESYKEAVAVREDQTSVALLAAAYARQGDRALAEKWFARLAEVSPVFSSFLAQARYLQRDRDGTRDPEVEAILQKGLEIAEDVDRTRAYLELANFYYGRERFDEAMGLLEKGIETEEETLDLIYALANYYNARGDNEKADTLIEDATRAEPDNPRPFLVLSGYLDRNGDLDGALAAAEAAIEIDPEHQDAILRRTEVLIKKSFRDRDNSLLKEGRAAMDEILAKEASNPGALLIRARIDVVEGELDAAIEGLRNAIDVRPDWAQAHFLLGTTLSLVQDDGAARAELARALELDASLVDARKVLARVHARLGESEYAVEEGRRFLRQRPNDVEARVQLAQALLRLDQKAAARTELESIPPAQRSPDVHFAFGRLDMIEEKYDSARASMLKALDERPANHEILGNLLQIDQYQGRFEESVERIDTALAASPDNAKLHQLRGVVSLALRQSADAETSFQRAIELDPNDLTSYRQLARYYTTQGRLEETIKTYEAAVERRPDSPQFLHFLGILYEYGGQRDLAIARYEDAIKYNPSLGVSKNNLAYLYAERGENLDRALDLAQEAKALLPESAQAADTLGWVLFKRGIPSAAISYLKEAAGTLELDSPHLGTVQHHLALAYEANGDLDRARETAEKALAELETQVAAAKERGAPVAEPTWANQARAMLERLGAEG